MSEDRDYAVGAAFQPRSCAFNDYLLRLLCLLLLWDIRCVMPLTAYCAKRPELVEGLTAYRSPFTIYVLNGFNDLQ